MAVTGLDRRASSPQRDCTDAEPVGRPRGLSACARTHRNRVSSAASGCTTGSTLFVAERAAWRPPTALSREVVISAHGFGGRPWPDGGLNAKLQGLYQVTRRRCPGSARACRRWQPNLGGRPEPSSAAG